MEITSYPKSELALMYFPKSDPHVALNHQSRFAKFYSPQAVRLIVEYLGEP